VTISNRNEPHPLEPLTWRARRDPFFLGCRLDEFARRSAWDDDTLAEHLQCPLDRLPLLFLCRCPADGDPNFAQQIRSIAEYAPCDATQLLLVLREAVAWSRLSGQPATQANRVFLAARDRQDTGSEPQDEDKPAPGGEAS
jgi:hypothetical protein